MSTHARALSVALAERGRSVDVASADAYARAVAHALLRWPTVAVDPARLARHVVERLEDGDVRCALEKMRLEELVIAFGCATGDPSALAAFEAAYFDEVERTLRRMATTTITVDELAQLVRLRLFVGTEAPPRIARYNGMGSLRAWLRVVVSRIALNAHTRRPREALVDTDILAEVAAGNDDTELALVKVKYRSEFREAVIAGLAALEPGDRLVLFQAHTQRLTIDRIAAIQGIHRATAARRLERARSSLVAATRAALATRMGAATGTEVDSIIRLIQSRFDITLGGLLAAAS